MADPDLQIRGWEGGCGHPDPEIGGQMVSKKFSWASVWSKIKGGGGGCGGAGPSPGSATANSLEIFYVDLQGA